MVEKSSTDQRRLSSKHKRIVQSILKKRWVLRWIFRIIWLFDKFGP